MIEAANAEEESLAIAVALREAVHDGKTAALVTPDRALGRRVLAALARWNIAAEDSGGDALAETPAGIFARLAAEAALGRLAPVTLLALLKHPLLRLAMSDRERAVAALERAILRGPRPRPGSDGLGARAAKLPRAARKIPARRAVDLHRSDPRIVSPTANLPPPPTSSTGLPRRWRRSKASASKRIRSAILPRAIATCSPRCRGRTAMRTRLRRPRRRKARGRAR